MASSFSFETFYQQVVVVEQLLRWQGLAALEGTATACKLNPDSNRVTS